MSPRATLFTFRAVPWRITVTKYLASSCLFPRTSAPYDGTESHVDGPTKTYSQIGPPTSPFIELVHNFSSIYTSTCYWRFQTVRTFLYALKHRPAIQATGPMPSQIYPVLDNLPYGPLCAAVYIPSTIFLVYGLCMTTTYLLLLVSVHFAGSHNLIPCYDGHSVICQMTCQSILSRNQRRAPLFKSSLSWHLELSNLAAFVSYKPAYPPSLIGRWSLHYDTSQSHILLAVILHHD